MPMTTIQRTPAAVRASSVAKAPAIARAAEPPKPARPAAATASAEPGKQVARWGLTALGAGLAGYATAWVGGSAGAIVAIGSSLPGAGMLVVGGLALGAVVGAALGGFGAYKLADKLLK